MSGIYIHIPFCRKQCSYCDFHFSTSFEGYQDRMVDALIKELEIRSANWKSESVETIYFGGGTPSLLTQDQLTAILKACRQFYAISEKPEVTLECNPDDCTSENLNSWKTAGVNRLSLGIQSLNNSQLSWMNRTHNASEGTEAIHRALAAGFENLTIDLMYGLPDLKLDEWKNQLEILAQLPVQHISAYCLTVEDKTVLSTWVKNKKLTVSSNQEQSEQFLALIEVLAKHGFEQYEISNFAREERYSKHNTNYWLGVPYVGIGPSAHGYNGSLRYWNVANNQVYMKAIEEGNLPETQEQLSAFDRFNELVMIGLRTKWGVSKQELEKELAFSPEWLKQKDEFITEGWLLETATHLVLTIEGRLRADAIASDLFVLDPATH